MADIQITLTLYGPLAKFVGGKYIAQQEIVLAEGAKFRDLLDILSIPYDQRGYVFINNILCDMPGLQASLDEVLENKARAGVFSLQHMWPYQYRDGIRMSDTLTKTLAEREGGAMHNTY
jgi:hypothetical protein